jgi:predicted dehydrogenase
MSEGRSVVEKVRWGILGTGKIARILAAAIGESAHGELVAVGSRTIDRARAFATDLGVPRSHDYEGLVADVGVDLVYVATHHPTHREWAVRAADSGKQVLCEKPMAVHHSDAAAIVEAARRNDVFLLEAFAYRCHPQTQRLVDLLAAGTVGEIRMIDAVFGYDAGPDPTNYLMDRHLGGGSILDVGCYTTSMAHLVAATAIGASVLETADVSGAGAIGPTGVDHSAVASLRFEDGTLARVACSIQANLDSSLRVYGTEGRIDVPSPWLPGRIGSEAEILVHRRDAEPERLVVPLGADVYTIEVDAVNGYVLMGERSPSSMTWEDSLANMRTLDRWRASIGLRYEGETSA